MERLTSPSRPAGKRANSSTAAVVAVLAGLAALAAEPRLAASGGAVEGTLPAEDGVALRYRVAGEGGKAVVVPLAAHLARELEPLARGGRRVVFYDPRGRGASERPADAASVDRDVSDLEALRKNLGLESFALVGWSEASLLAARYAIEHPGRVERLVLIAPAAPRRDPYRAEAEAERAARLPEDFGARLEALRRAGLERRDPAAFAREAASLARAADFADEKAFDRLESAPWEHANEWRENLDRALAAGAAALGAYDWRHDLEHCAVPTLVIHGSRDCAPVAGSREWVESRNGRLLLVPGAARYPFAEKRDAFFAAMEAFLAGGWPNGSEIVGAEREHDH